MRNHPRIQQARAYWLRLISPAQPLAYADELRQARLLGAILILMAPLWVILEGFTLWTYYDQGYRTNPLVVLCYLIAVLAFWVNRRGHLNAAAWLIVILSSVFMFVSAFDPVAMPPPPEFLYYMAMLLVFAGLFLPEYSLPLLAGLYLLGMAVAAWLNAAFDFQRLLFGPGLYLVTVAGMIALTNRQRGSLERDRRRALETSERRYRLLFENASDAIFLMDVEMNYIEVNPAAAELLGYTRAELIGKNTIEVIAPDEHPDLARRRELAVSGADQPIYERRMRRKDGAIFPAEINLRFSPAADGRPAYIQSLVRDISERKAAEARLQRQVSQLHALRRIDRIVAAGKGLDEMCATLLTETMTQLDAHAAAVLLIDPAGGLQVSAARGLSDEDTARLAAGLEPFLPRWIAGETHPQRLLDMPAAPGACGFAAPLRLKDAVEGALLVYRSTHFDPPYEWLEFFEILAGQAAIVVDSAGMRLNLVRSHDELLAAYDATLEGWSRALELRDYETHGHSERVTDLAVDLARSLGLSDAELVNFRRGALLHDIGKMGIPDAILFKTGPLTHAEWDIMHLHPVHAYEFLKDIPFLASALEIPYAHHERWDGSGYPRGLRDTAIPRAARIFAVADVWDALTSDRPYRRAWTAASAWRFLCDNAGVQFDPEVVAALGRKLGLA